MAIMTRLTEFFEGENKRLSMPRLCMFMSFWPATAVMLWKQEADIFAWYLSSFAAAYGVASVSGAIKGRGRNADNRSYDAD